MSLWGLSLGRGFFREGLDRGQRISILIFRGLSWGFRRFHFNLYLDYGKRFLYCAEDSPQLCERRKCADGGYPFGSYRCEYSRVDGIL